VWGFSILVPKSAIKKNGIAMEQRNALARRLVGYTIAVGVASAVLAGCDGKPAATATAPTNQVTGQVIAHVGKQDVTIQELDNEFRWNGIPVDKRNDDAVVKRFLSELVLRKYLAERAVEAGLDRDPTVLLDLLRARDQVLAQAFIARDVSSKVTAIGKAQIDGLIASQPWRFGDRQTMTVEEITIPPTPEMQAVMEATKNLKSLDDIDQKLNELKVLHSRSMGVLSSAQLNEQLFNTIKEKMDTDQFFIRTPSGGVFFKVKGMQSSPLTGEEAEKAARQLLISDVVREETQTKALAATADAEVKYEGQYAHIMGKEEPTKPADSK
jgi:EpsD family peptidyl-prolyl cis-trans isomerase